MSDSVKANDKLPRGSFYYVQVGHRFYAGEAQESVNRERTIKVPRGPCRPYWWSPKKASPRIAKDSRSGKLARYLTPRKDSKVTEKVLTGNHFTELVDEVLKAKQFRKKNQALAACERLETVYSNLDTKVTVKLYEGEKT